MTISSPSSRSPRVTAPALALALAGLLGPCAAMADIAPAFLGTWKANWEGEKQTYYADVEISEAQSTWKTLQPKRSTNPCFALKAPMKVESSDAKRVRFTIQSSEAMRGCTDGRLTLRIDDANRVTANFNGRDVEIKPVAK